MSGHHWAIGQTSKSQLASKPVGALAHPWSQQSGHWLSLDETSKNTNYHQQWDWQ
jgi:hypothetical protein